MSATMGLIYLADTLHVLATFTRAAEPTTPETAPDSFVGAGLHVRVREHPPGPPPDTMEFTVLPANLKFADLALDPFVLDNPREHYLDTSATPPKPTPYTNGALAIAFPGPAGQFTVPAITALANVTKFAVLVRSLADGSTTYSAPPMGSGGSTVDLATAFPSGKYHVLVCVGGYGLVHFNANL